MPPRLARKGTLTSVPRLTFPVACHPWLIWKFVRTCSLGFKPQFPQWRHYRQPQEETKGVPVTAGHTVPAACPQWESRAWILRLCVPLELRALQGEAEQVVDARGRSVPSAVRMCSSWVGSPLALFLRNVCLSSPRWVLFDSAGLRTKASAVEEAQAWGLESQ